jgi:putative DNA primase/helicase
VVIERLLSISGEDALTVDRKNMTPVTSTLDTRLVLLSNELPRFSDASGALAGRMLMLNLSQSWFGREDPGLFTRLQLEMPGILLWAIEGWRRLRERGHFEVPDASREVERELNDLASPVGAFVRERCEVGAEHRVPKTQLYQCYQHWCREENILRVMNQAHFGRDLRAVVPTIGTTQQHDGSRWYVGIRLKRAAAQQGTQQGTHRAQQANSDMTAGRTPQEAPAATGATGNATGNATGKS